MRLGVIGAGFNANFHATAMRAVRDVCLAGVYAPKGAEELSARARSEGLGDAVVYPTIFEMCKNVDVVGIFCPNFARLEVISAIADAVKCGAALKGIIVEKPLARNLAEARAFVDVANGLGIPQAYFENQIHMSAVVGCRAQLANVTSAMGNPHLARSAEEHGGPHEPWFWDPTRQGGGVWCDMGCHSAAVGWWMLTPPGKAPDFLKPIGVTATMGLLKWRHQPWLGKLLERGVDYTKTPAEDYALVTIEFQNPETGQIVLAQATDSWMYDAPGLRLAMEVMGPAYSYNVDSLSSPAGLFIGDAAAEAVANAELALEKSQATRGKLVMQPDEADLYGYIGEQRNAFANFAKGQSALLDFKYGLDVVLLVMAGYMSQERGCRLDLTDPNILAELETYVPLIQQGRGAEVLGPVVG